MVGEGLVGGRLLVGRGMGVVFLLRGVLGLSLVLDISNVARVVIGNGVGHSLDPAIGKGHTVSAVGGITVLGLISLEVNILVLISNGIAELVGFILVDGLLVGLGGMVGSGLVVCWGISRGGVVSRDSGNAEGKEGSKGLKNSNEI